MALLGSMSADAEQRLGATQVRADVARIEDVADQVAAAFSFPLVGTGISTFMLKGSWAAGRVGKPLLSAYKHALSHDVAFFELIDTLLALLCIGRRSSKLRVEIAKAIRAAPGRAENDHARRLRAAMGREVELVCESTAELLERSEDDFAAMLRRFGLRCFDEEVDPTDPTTLDIADSLPLMGLVDGITDGHKLVSTMAFAAAAARLPAERFYLRHEVYSVLRQPWTPDDTLRMLDPIARAEGARQAAWRDTLKVGRNSPCPCGSGAKYKRCCARA